MFGRLLALALVYLSSQALLAQQPELLGKVKFRGDLGKDAKEVSAIGIVGDLVILGADERRHVYVFKPSGADYDLVREIKLEDTEEEIDIEGITCDDRIVYVVGSHSKTRKKPKPDASYKENQKRIATIEDHPSRERLFQFKLDSTGHERETKTSSLRHVIRKSDVLSPFIELPSKENGVDIEGLAIRDGRLYAGFRGPVLAENFVPVLTCEFAEDIRHANVVFVQLGGRGIRDLTRSRDVLLVLAGPVGDGPGSYQLYSWDGRDCLPGMRDTGSIGKRKLLCEIPDFGAKAEGIALTKETDASYEFLIVYDGLENGGARRFRLSK